MKRDESGFTLMEMIVVIAMIAILTAIALPYYQGWAQNAKYREAASEAVSVLREAQSRAVSENTPYEVDFTPNTSSTGSGSYSLKKNGTTVVESDSFPTGVKIYQYNSSSGNCDQSLTSALPIKLYPNGTADASNYVCVMDGSGGNLYRAGVQSTATGRAVMQKWNGSDNKFE